MNTGTDTTPTNISLQLESRIKTARRVIREATTAARKFVQTDQTVVGVDVDDGNHHHHQYQYQDGYDNAAIHSKSNAVGGDASKTMAEEFDLAMMLFSDDARGIEEDINMKLTKVEHELYNYFERKQEYGYGYGQGNGQGQGQGHGRVEENEVQAPKSHRHAQIDYASFGIGGTGASNNEDEKGDEEMSMPMSTTCNHVDRASLLETEARQLTVKINFLKKCSEARMALEDVTNGFLQASVSKGTVMVISPRNSNGNGNGNSQSTSGSSLVDIARHLSRAKKALAEAEEYLHRSSPSGSGSGSGSESTEPMKNQDAIVAREFVESIQSQIRRKNVDVYAKACEILSSCITIDSSSISICEGQGQGQGSPNSKSEDGNGDGKGDDYFKPKSTSRYTYEGLKVALDVLAILSEDDDSKKLENAISNIAKEVSTVVLRPVILATRVALDKAKGGVGGKEGGGGGAKAHDLLPSWEFHESQVQMRVGGAGASGLKSSSSASSKTKELVSTLEWKKLDPVPQNASRKIDSNSGGHNADLTWWVNLLEFIQKVTKFIADKVLSQREDIGLMYGKATFGNVPSTKNPYTLSFDETVMEHGENCPIVKLLGRLLWDHCIPESSSVTTTEEFSNVRKVVVDSTQTFEKYLKSAGLMKNPTPLAEYGNCFEDKYNEKVRTMILGRGRKILLEGDYHNSVKVGINVHDKRQKDRAAYLDHIDLEDNDMSVFVFEECAISQVALNLFDLCRETMDLAVKPESLSYSSLLPATLFRSSRELLDLFRAVIPAAHGSEIATIPRTAAMFHNDCVFFAHKLLTFGLQYRDKFPQIEEGKEPALKKICTYLDMVPIFRELADRAMNDMIRHQKVQLSEIISPRIGYLSVALGSDEGVVEWTDAETALTAGLYHLRHLSQNWKNILSHDVYCRTMGGLADALFFLYLDKVLAAKDISVSACHFVSALFRDALRGITELFGSSPSPSSEPNEAAKEAQKFCEFQDKFSAIGRFMDMSLADITMTLSEGLFKSVTGAELSRLVVAVFENTDARSKLLRLLESN